MNINKRMNQLHKKVNEKVEEVVLMKTDLFREKVMTHYQPMLKDIENRVVEIYKYPSMEFNQFKILADELADLIFPIIENLEQDVYELTRQALQESELGKVVKEAINDILISNFIIMRLDKRRAEMEVNKAYHNYLAKTTRFANLTLAELITELRNEIMYHVESVMEYMESDRVICDEDEEQEEIEQQKSSLIKMTELRQVIDYVEERGYEKVRTTGSHHIYRNEEGKTTVIPIHGKDFHKGLAYNIQKQVEE